MEDIIRRLSKVNTMPELDKMRAEVAIAMMEDPDSTFQPIQDAFRKAKNRLTRIPLKDRTW